MLAVMERERAVTKDADQGTGPAKTKTIGFRPTGRDERIIKEAMRDGESTTDVIRRALRKLEREAWLAKFHADVERLRDEDLSDEPDAW